ncbi:hypothetical protein QR680_005252 [Steinernema hermaphroditum]|uniref:Ground-like domain-containing protein n=1 Tax=Steinernema hermaphroditum TaxID=289476 RepID=A0AA39HRB6_9BILA|nr:hypothetical protein QR680_005252 [Steinernema hermaphroditum]
MRLVSLSAILALLVGPSAATFLSMSAGPTCCCGCESNCPPQAPTCPPPQNPCPATSYWFGQQYQRCSSFNGGGSGGVAWRQPYSEFVSSGGLQPSYNSFSPGFSAPASPSASFQQDFNGGNYIYQGAVSTAAPFFSDAHSYNSAPAPAAPPAASESFPAAPSPDYASPAASLDPSPPASSDLHEVEPALIRDSESLVENHYDQFDNPTDRSPQVIAIQKTIHVATPPLNFSDYDGDYVDVDALPKHKIDHESNQLQTSETTEATEDMRFVDSDILTTTAFPPKVTRKTKFLVSKNKSVDPEMVRIGRVLGEIETMLEMVKKEMEIDVYDEDPPQLPKDDDDDAAKRFFAGDYVDDADFVNILDQEDTDIEEAEVQPSRNLTMQEIIENLRMQHLRAERRRKFIETLEARVLAEQRVPRLRRAVLPLTRTNGTVGGEDIHCNSNDLKEIINREIVDVFDSASAKRKIQKAAEEQLKGIFNVICSNSEFSFVINSALFCESGNGKVACFAFLEPGSV